MAGRTSDTPPHRRGGILSGPVDGPERVAARYPEVPAAPGTVVVHRASAFRGSVIRFEGDTVVLRTPTGGERLFALVPGAFLLDSRPVTLVRPRAAAPAGPRITASGSIAGRATGAKVARASRILVEGVHDGELLEKVWGDDLRELAIVVEVLDGVDQLPDTVRSFAPGPGRRLGVLVDHLVPGSKEARLAAAVDHPHVLVTGHPYVDVWQAIRPKVLGIDAWPEVPRGRPWKEGICEVFGVHEPGLLWKRLLGSVRTHADLEPGLVGAVEQLLDFLTEGESFGED